MTHEEKTAILKSNCAILSLALQALNLSVYDSRDASIISSWIESAKDLCKAYCSFLKEGFNPDSE